MKIESYEPFHIGSKLRPYVDKRLFLTKIYDYYEENKLEGFDLDRDILKSVSITPFLSIATNPKEKLTIQLNLAADALNVIGDDSEKVVKIFSDLLTILPDLGFDLDLTFSFYEIIVNVILLLEEQDKKPLEIFKIFSKNLFTEIGDIPELNMNYIRFSNNLVNKEEEERFNLEILPNRTSPSKRIILKILNRVYDHNKLIKFENRLKDIINLIYEKLVE